MNMRKHVAKTIQSFIADPADTEFQRGFRGAYLELDSLLARDRENRRIAIGKWSIALAFTASMVFITWGLFHDARADMNGSRIEPYPALTNRLKFDPNGNAAAPRKVCFDLYELDSADGRAIVRFRVLLDGGR